MLTPTVAADLFESYATLPAAEAIDAFNAFEAADDDCLRGAWRLLRFADEQFSRKAFYGLLDSRRRASQAGKDRGGRAAWKAKE